MSDVTAVKPEVLVLQHSYACSPEKLGEPP